MLNVAPDFDAATVYSAKWNQRLMEELDEEHHSLLAEDAVRSNFTNYVKELNPDLVVFYDHGVEGALIGNDMRPLIDSRNVNLLSGREMYTMCCLAGQNLGPEAYRKGCKAFWSYTQVFSFVTTDEETFGRLANLGLILRIKERLSWEDCIKRVKDAYNEEINKGGNPWTIISLINDRDALICWTDANQPPSDCTFRKLSIKLFGKAGQKLSQSFVLTTIAYYIAWGYGVHETLQLEGSNIVLEGAYTTLALMFILPIALIREHIKWLKH